MKKISIKELSSLFDDIQLSLSKFKDSLKSEDISSTTKQQLKDLNDSIKNVGMSFHNQLYDMSENNKKTFNGFKKLHGEMDNYLQHLSVLGGSVSQFSFAQYKVIKDYANIFDDIGIALSNITHKIGSYKKTTEQKLSNIDNKINKYILLGDKYVTNIGKLQNQGNKLTTKQINKLNEHLSIVEKEENILKQRKTQLAKRVGDQLQEQQLSSQFEQLSKRRQIIEQQLQEEKEKRQKYVQYSVGYNEKFSQEQLNKYQQIFSEDIKGNNDEVNNIQKQISELVKIQYDENISNKKRNEQLDEIEQLNKKKQYLEEQNLELQKKIEKLENTTPSKSSYLNFLNPITKMLGYQFNKKSPIMRVFSGLSSIWKVFTKGIKILTKLPELLSPIYWLFKIGTIVAGFITLMVASPTFRRLVEEGISKLGDLLKDQFIQIGENVQKGLKWLVWNEPIHLIDEYITKPLQKGIKSLQSTIKYAVWEEPIDLINKYIISPLQTGIQGWYSNVKDFVKSIPDNIKTQWNKISGGIQNQFTGIYNIITKNPITNFIKDTWNKISGQLHNIFGYIGYVITHPLHHESFGDYIKGLQPKEQKPPNLKQYPVENPNTPLISNKNNVQSTISKYTNNLTENPNTSKISLDSNDMFIIQSLLQERDFLIHASIPLPAERRQFEITWEKGLKSFKKYIPYFKKIGAFKLFKQKGGLITGPGSGTDDKIETQLSNGEYVVPQNIVKQYPILMSTIEQLRKGVGINTIIAPIKNIFDNIVTSTKSVYSDIKNDIIDTKNKVVKDLFGGNIKNLVQDIKNIFNDVKKSFKGLITNFNNIIPDIKKSFKSIAENFGKQASNISSNIKSIGNIANTIGLSGIGGFLSKIAGPVGTIITGSEIMKNVTDWGRKNITDPINHFMHGIFSWWGDTSQRSHYQNGGLVPGGYSSFDNVNAKLSSGEYIIPNYITSEFPSLIKKIEELRIQSQPHQIHSTSINSSLFNDNPLIKLISNSDNNFGRLNNILDKLTKTKSELPSSNIIQSNNVNSTNINSSDNYDLILGDISV